MRVLLPSADTSVPQNKGPVRSHVSRSPPRPETFRPIGGDTLAAPTAFSAWAGDVPTGPGGLNRAHSVLGLRAGPEPQGLAAGRGHGDTGRRNTGAPHAVTLSRTRRQIPAQLSPLGVRRAVPGPGAPLRCASGTCGWTHPSGPVPLSGDTHVGDGLRPKQDVVIIYRRRRPRSGAGRGRQGTTPRAVPAPFPP